MRQTILILIFTLFYLSNVNGQDYKMGVPFTTSFTEKDFGVSNQNSDIVQDSRGIIYLANDYGVLEFDGSQWNIIQSPYNRSITWSLAFGADNKLYIGAQDFFGFIEYEGKAGLGVKSLVDLLPMQEKNFGNVWKIFPKGEKVVFFTWSAIFIYHQNAIKVVKDKHPMKMIFKVGEQLFISGAEGLMELKNDSLLLLPNTSKFIDHDIAFIASYSNGKILIATQNDGLFLYDFQDLKPFRVSDYELFKNSKLQCGIILRNGFYLAGTSENGLILFNNEGKVLQHITKICGLGHNHIKQVLEDKDGNWWIINEKGIDIVEASSPFYRISIDSENPFSVYTSCVFNNNLYVGCHAGLYYTGWKDFFNYLSHPLQFIKIPGVGDICWKLDTMAGNLYLFNGDGFYIIKNNVSKLLYKGAGTWTFIRPVKNPHVVIVGTYEGLTLFAIENGQLNFKRKLGGYSETSRVMEEDNEGNIWISHGYKGVYKVTLTEKYDSIISVKFYNSLKGFPSNLFINVFKINNEIVFGTQSGVYKYDKAKDSMIIHPYYASILGTKYHVRYLHEDKLKRIWYIMDKYTGTIVMHPDGTYSIQKVPFQKLTSDYIPGFENFFFFNNGDALVGTKNGMIFYNQQMPFQPKSDYAAIISKVTYPSDLSKKFYDERLRFFGDTCQVTKIEIPFKRNSLRFDYTACFYENIDQTEFSYYLEGYDEIWSDWTVVRFKDFTNLPEGKYAFHVKAKNVFEEESKEAIFRFVVLAPWYRTPYAYVAYFILIFILVWALFKIRAKRFELEKRRIIEEREKERQLEQSKYYEEKLTSDLDNKNKELASSALKIIYKNEKMLEIKKLIETINPNTNDELLRKLSSILQFIDKELKDDQWDDFELRFDQANNNFIKRLKEAYPDLSSWDLKVCAYLKMNLSTKEIAQILNMTVRGVETARFRIRKRMGLESTDNLNDFILKF